jgi:hypothetical protein
MKNSKSHKMNKLTKSEYHNDIVPAFVAYRKAMEKACKVYSSSDYSQIFTERRSYGARSKYWGSRNSLPTDAIIQYTLNNPTFTTAAGRKLTVTTRSVRGNVYYSQRPDFAVFCNLSK